DFGNGKLQHPGVFLFVKIKIEIAAAFHDSSVNGQPHSIGWFEAEGKIRRSEVAAVIGKAEQAFYAQPIHRRLDRAQFEAEGSRDFNGEAAVVCAEYQVERRQRNRPKVHVQWKIDLQL